MVILKKDIDEMTFFKNEKDTGLICGVWREIV